MFERGGDSRFELSGESLLLAAALFDDQLFGVVGDSEAGRLVEHDDVLGAEVRDHAGDRGAE